MEPALKASQSPLEEPYSSGEGTEFQFLNIVSIVVSPFSWQKQKN